MRPVILTITGRTRHLLDSQTASSGWMCRHILQAVCGVPNALLTFGKENGLSGKGGSSAGWVRPTLFV